MQINWRTQAKWFILAAIIIFAVANTRIDLIYRHHLVTLQALVDFNYHRPFSLRVLPFLILNPLQRITQLPLPPLLFFLESINITTLVISLYWVIKQWLPARPALLAAFIFLGVIPYTYVVHYLVNFYYPYDIAALHFLIFGIFCMWQRRWGWLYFIMVLATLNRESSALLMLLLFAVRPPGWRWQSVFVPAAILFWLFILIRAGTSYLLRDTPGVDVSFFYGDELRALRNLRWLQSPQHVLMLISNLVCLPIIWWTLKQWIPEALRRVCYVALLYFIGLLWVGNFYEPRIFGEIIVLLYFPSVIALYNWAIEKKHLSEEL